MLKLTINSSAITRFLGIIACILVLASIGGQLSKFIFGHPYLKGLVPLFDLGDEYNIPTYYSELLMLIISMLLTIVAILNWKINAPYIYSWAMLSFGFLLMAYDEIFMLHERLEPLGRLLLGGNTNGIFHFAWIIPGIALVVFFAMFFLKFLLYLSFKIRLRFLIAAAIFFGGAIGFESLGGYYVELYDRDLTYNMITTVEESLELAGLIFFIRALLIYYAENFKEMQFQFDTK